jgi:hypothetical protein
MRWHVHVTPRLVSAVHEPGANAIVSLLVLENRILVQQFDERPARAGLELGGTYCAVVVGISGLKARLD